MPPFFSIIIPVYNRASLAMEAVQSAAAQSWRSFEIIVLDDGSNDDLPQRLAAFQQQNSALPLTCLRQKHTGLPGQARNAAAALAKGRYLAFLDSDDLWLPQKLAVAAAKIETSQYQIKLIHTKELWIRDGRSVKQKEQNFAEQGPSFAAALAKCLIGPSTACIERAFFEELGGFNSTLCIAEDYELWLRALSRASAYYINEALTVKRAGSWPCLSGTGADIERWRIQALQIALVEGGLNPVCAGLARRELARKQAIYAAGALKRGRRAEAAACLREALAALEEDLA